MAEDNQEAEMEDILSSIKNILEEDEQNKSVSVKSSEPVEKDVLDNVLASSDTNDILELSPEMRVSEEPLPQPEKDSAERDIVASVMDEPIINPLADDADPTDIIAMEKQVTADENSDDSFLNEKEPFVEPTVAPEPEIVADAAPEPFVEPSAATEAAADSAVDVSAGIISNFAKMFAKGKETENETRTVEITPSSEIIAPGDTSKTLEQFVQDAIMKAIGNEILRQWNNGSDFKSFAEAEVIRQTEKWLNDHLPALVEKVVKQEIERVMVKVGS